MSVKAFLFVTLGHFILDVMAVVFFFMASRWAGLAYVLVCINGYSLSSFRVGLKNGVRIGKANFMEGNDADK